VSEFETVRRVITAQTKDGANVFLKDDEVEPIVIGPIGIDNAGSHSGHQLWQIWGADGIPQLPNDGCDGYANTNFAPPGGYRVAVCEFPAEGAPPRTPRGAWPATGTGVARVDPGLHYTDSVDLMIVLDGEIGLEQDDGVEVLLRAGDVLVQNGAAHAWKNKSVPCRIMMVMLGAEREKGKGESEQ
jgi:hypothetical protein